MIGVHEQPPVPGWGASAIGTLRRFVLSYYSLGLLFVGWEVVTQLEIIRPAFLPSLSSVLRQFFLLAEDGSLVQPISTSLYRSATGLGIAVAIGATLGLAAARSELARVIWEPLVSIGFPLPKVAVIPILILWFGIYDNSKIALVVFTCVFPVAMSVEAAVAGLPTVIQWSARSLGASRSTLLRTVVLPAALPGLMAGIRVALPLALLATFTAEMVGGGGGFGASLMYAQRLFDAPTVFVYLLLMLLFGLLADRAFLFVRRRLVGWSDQL